MSCKIKYTDIIRRIEDLPLDLKLQESLAWSRSDTTTTCRGMNYHNKHFI